MQKGKEGIGFGQYVTIQVSGAYVQYTLLFTNLASSCRCNNEISIQLTVFICIATPNSKLQPPKMKGVALKETLRGHYKLQLRTKAAYT